MTITCSNFIYHKDRDVLQDGSPITPILATHQDESGVRTIHAFTSRTRRKDQNPEEESLTNALCGLVVEEIREIEEGDKICHQCKDRAAWAGEAVMGDWFERWYEHDRLRGPPGLIHKRRAG